MSNDLERTGPEDSRKININLSSDVIYWCQKLGVTESELRRAVESVGPLVVDVEKCIAEMRQRPRPRPRPRPKSGMNM